MRKSSGNFCLLLGAVLLLSALLLFIHNRREDEQAGEAAAAALAELKELMEQQEPTPTANEAHEIPASAQSELSEPSPTAEEADSAMSADALSSAYLGLLEIPNLELTLPVWDDWDYDRMQSAPCRQFGSCEGGNLVIAAHNFLHHFGRLRELTPGADLSFTDMEGKRYSYCVEALETLNPEEINRVYQSGYALVLYTCTKDGQKRVTVFCSKAETSK